MTKGWKKEPRSTHYVLTLSELNWCREKQLNGWFIGDVAEYFEITVSEAQLQLGIYHTSQGVEYRGHWRDPLTINREAA